MAFTVHGTIDSRPASVTWDAGSLSGDEWAITSVQALIDSTGALGVTATGPFVKPGLDHASRALLTICSVFDVSPLLAGDVPEPMRALPMPPGAVA